MTAMNGFVGVMNNLVKKSEDAMINSQSMVLDAVVTFLEEKNVMTDEVRDALSELKETLKSKKKMKTKKEKVPRFSGYHLFMKEHRAIVQEEQPDLKPQMVIAVLSKKWKEGISQEDKDDFNARAAKLKEEYMNENNISSDEEKKEKPKEVEKPKKEKKEKVEKPKKEKVEKPKKEKKKPAKKIETPPSSEEEEEEDVRVEMEEAESDIDL